MGFMCTPGAKIPGGVSQAAPITGNQKEINTLAAGFPELKGPSPGTGAGNGGRGAKDQDAFHESTRFQKLEQNAGSRRASRRSQAG